MREDYSDALVENIKKKDRISSHNSVTIIYKMPISLLRCLFHIIMRHFQDYYQLHSLDRNMIRQ